MIDPWAFFHFNKSFKPSLKKCGIHKSFKKRISMDTKNSNLGRSGLKNAMIEDMLLDAVLEMTGMD